VIAKTSAMTAPTNTISRACRSSGFSLDFMY